MARVRRRTARPTRDSGPTQEKRAALRQAGRIFSARWAFSAVGDTERSMALRCPETLSDTEVANLLADADARFGPPDGRTGRYHIPPGHGEA